MKMALLSIATALILSSSVCHADFIVGSVGFNIEVEPVTGALEGELQVSELRTKKARSGFFADVAFPQFTPWGDFTIGSFSMAGSPISISNADFGSFDASVIRDTVAYADPANPLSKVVGRNMSFLGTWIPGTNPLFVGYTNPVEAEIAFTLTTTNDISGSVLNGAIVFAARGEAIPEPGSVLFLSASAVAVQLRRRFKRRTESAAEQTVAA